MKVDLTEEEIKYIRSDLEMTVQISEPRVGAHTEMGQARAYRLSTSILSKIRIGGSCEY